jgi:hypothetical protein
MHVRYLIPKSRRQAGRRPDSHFSAQKDFIGKRVALTPKDLNLSLNSKATELLYEIRDYA